MRKYEVEAKPTPFRLGRDLCFSHYIVAYVLPELMREFALGGALEL
jgi:hypothetical protein